MFCITLQGGLGNQLFQYAFGQMLAKHYATEVLYDDANYSTFSIFSLGCFLGLYTPRTLALERFDLQIQRPSWIQRFNLGSTGRHKIASKFFGRKNNQRKDEEQVYMYDSSWFSLDKSKQYVCTGYRNVAQYYAGMETLLRKEIRLKNESKKLQELSAILEQQHSEGIQTVSIHIRGGDYVKLGMVICDSAYYQHGLEEIKKAFGIERIHVYVFSDDPANLPIDVGFLDAYITTRIIFDDYYKAQGIDQEGFDDVEKFILMSRCTHHLIANSTYSWWSAWLSDTGTTFAPKMWLQEISSEQIVPNEWNRI